MVVWCFQYVVKQVCFFGTCGMSVDPFLFPLLSPVSDVEPHGGGGRTPSKTWCFGGGIAEKWFLLSYIRPIALGGIFGKCGYTCIWVVGNGRAVYEGFT